MIDSGVDAGTRRSPGASSRTVDFTGGDGQTATATGRTWRRRSPGRRGGWPRRPTTAASRRRARIVNLRVLGDDGSGLASDVIEAIDWAIENRKAYDIRVINLSLGAPVLQPYRDDPMCEAVERAVAAGIVVVAAAGNYGRNGGRPEVLGGITSPGNDPDGDHGGRGRHARDGAAVGRHAGAVQLARADAVRPGAEAGSGGAGQPDRVGGGGRVRIWRRPTRTGTWRAPARTPTSSCRARAWRRRS